MGLHSRVRFNRFLWDRGQRELTAVETVCGACYDRVGYEHVHQLPHRVGRGTRTRRRRTCRT